MPTVRCGKTSCCRNHDGVCSRSYIRLEPVGYGTKVQCMQYKTDKGYEEALAKVAANPKLQRDKEEDET